MSNEKYKNLESYFENTDFKLLDVKDVNHKPHPFMIGPKHVHYASEHHHGMLGVETLRAVPCAHPGCRLSYDEHTCDSVAFLQLKKNLTNDEAKIILQGCEPIMNELHVDGFCFVETEEKFRISNN